MTENDKVAWSERGIRFGCGALMGLIVGTMAAIGALAEDWRLVLLIASGVAMTFGVLAARYSDRFWYRLGRLLWSMGEGSRRRPPW